MFPEGEMAAGDGGTVTVTSKLETIDMGPRPPVTEGVLNPFSKIICFAQALFPTPFRPRLGV